MACIFLSAQFLGECVDNQIHRLKLELQYADTHLLKICTINNEEKVKNSISSYGVIIHKIGWPKLKSGQAKYNEI